ncbi:MAG: alpha-N-arabinofuranosidase [Clostridia bacterium]|nr:alpha-N-arabinofuranosidase [Clostridia bacterium]
MNPIIYVDAAHPGSQISRLIYGQFAEHLGRCIYGGVFVGKDSAIPNVNGIRQDVVEALRAIRVPMIRWPGGCFADEYHWRDGIGENRKRMVNTNWGGVVEDNSFGTHEFLELCRQVGCEPYINANVGSGSVREMAEWVEYLNSDGDSSVVQERWKNGQKEAFGVRYFGVGNENWGCGGNMRPEYYADEYRRYQTYCRNYGDHRLFRIACGPSEGDWHWTETLMERAGHCMDGLTLHYYTVPTSDWKDKGSATEFDLEMYYRTLERALRMEDLIRGHLAIMDRYDPEKKVKLLVDEWGTWHNVEPGTNPGFLYQQNTMRDAMVASVTLDIFQHHADRLGICCIAQMVNVLQAMILTEGDKMVLTPTYHVFGMYRDHQDAQALETGVLADRIPGGAKQISASASVRDGKITVTCSNLDGEKAAPVSVYLQGVRAEILGGEVLCGAPQSMNTFEQPDQVAPKSIDGAEVTAHGDGTQVTFTMPACSVATLHLNVLG